MKKPLNILLLILLLLDIGYSFTQHYHVSLDGDMASIILPSASYQKVLDDPFGFAVLLHDSVYAAPNRFFAHWFMSGYFKAMPLFLQHFTSPINSIYLSCAIAKTAIQVLLIFLLAVFISGKTKTLNKDFLLAAILVTPLFQTFGYNSIMGVIDKSVTYTFFYAFSVGLVMLFFLPFYNASYSNNSFRFSRITIALLILLSVVISFNGSLNPAIILLICPFTILYQWWLNSGKYTDLPLSKRLFKSFHDIPKPLLIIFIMASVLCLYSFYIGMNNSENLWETIPLTERYARLPRGLYEQFTGKLGPPLLIIIITINALIIKKQKPDEAGKRILNLLRWIIIFSTIYFILLPLGGYRSYRPNIIRRDTILPILLALFFIYGISSLYLIKNIHPKYKKWYIAGIVAFILIFTNADAPKFNHNECERNALQEISQSSEKIILLESNCTVMSWGKITNFHDSKTNAELLHYWRVIDKEKYYYQR